MVVIDVLHCLDLGVSQDALGNLFYDAVNRSNLFSGRSQEERFKCLWAMIRVYYQQTRGVSTPVQSMTWEMVKRDSKGPKLRTKGAETRGLVPFGLRLALAMRADDNTPYTRTQVRAFAALFQSYCLMGHAWDATAAKASCREFLVMYKALPEESLQHRGGDIRFWKVKPKFHMFQELGEYKSQSLGIHPNSGRTSTRISLDGLLDSQARGVVLSGASQWRSEPSSATELGCVSSSGPDIVWLN